MQALCIFVIFLCCSVARGAPRGDPHHPPGLRNNVVKVTRDWEKMALDDIERALGEEKIVGEARNVILFLGDGMGLSTITGARQLMAQLDDAMELPDAALEWDKFYNVGLSKDGEEATSG